MRARGLLVAGLAGLLLAPAIASAQAQEGAPAPSVTAATPAPSTAGLPARPDELLEVIHHIPDAVLDLRYATTNNFVGEVMYPANSRCLLRRDVLLRLETVAEALRARGLRLKLWDCYRPIAVQWKLWERFPKPGYVANPKRGGNHNRGAAVDLTLVDAKGVELEMPTPFDSFEKAAHQGYRGGTARSRANREILRSAMVAAGFRINRSEWWHFDAPGALKLPVRDEPLVQVASP